MAVHNIGGVSLLPPDNIWNVPVNTLPVHSNSDAYITAIGGTIPFLVNVSTPTFNPPFGWGVPYNLVTNSTPTSLVAMYYAGSGYEGLYPIPASPAIEIPFFPDSDRHLLTLNTDTGVAYEITGFAAIGYQTAVLADAPWGYYRLGGVGYGGWWTGTTVPDTSGNGRDGTAHGAVNQVYAQCMQGAADGNTAALFGGTTADYISLPTSGLPTGASAWSLECWVKMPASLGSYPYATLLEFGTFTGASNQGVRLDYGGGFGNVFVLDDKNYTLGTCTGGTPVANGIFHIVGTYDGTAARLYVNGVLVGGPVTYALNITLTQALIGAAVESTGAWANLISDVAIYPSALSLARVQAHYSAGTNTTGPFTGTSGWKWDMASNILPFPDATAGDAASLPVLPGLLCYDEVASGTISHALRIAIPFGSGTYVWPAKHADGTALGVPPHGSRLRLKSTTNIGGYSASNQVILTALKTYGAMIADQERADVDIRLYGVGDSRWSDTDIHTNLSCTLHASDFEVVDQSGLEIVTFLGATTPQTFSYAATVLADSPNAYYRLGESSGVVAHDQTSHHYDGAINGGVTPMQRGAITYDPDTAMSFNGSSGYISLPTGLNPTGWTAATFEWWMYLASAANYPVPISNAQADSSHTGFHIYIDAATSKIYLVYGVSGSAISANSSTAITLNTWQHIAVVVSGTTAAFYINGANAGTVSGLSTAFSLIASANPISIGWIQASNGSFVQGILDEVAIYNNNALTHMQVYEHYMVGIAGHAVGKITGATGTNTMRLGTQVYGDIEASTCFMMSSTDIVGVTVRDTGLNNFVRLRYRAGQVEVVQQTPTAFTTLASSAFSLPINTQCHLKIRAVGTVVYGRVWIDTDSEPSIWQLSSVTTVTNAGQVGVAVSLAAAADVVQFIAFTATSASSDVPTSTLKQGDMHARAGVSTRLHTQSIDMHARARLIDAFIDVTSITTEAYSAIRGPLERRFPK